MKDEELVERLQETRVRTNEDLDGRLLSVLEAEMDTPISARPGGSRLLVAASLLVGLGTVAWVLFGKNFGQGEETALTDPGATQIEGPIEDPQDPQQDREPEFDDVIPNQDGLKLARSIDETLKASDLVARVRIDTVRLAGAPGGESAFEVVVERVFQGSKELLGQSVTLTVTPWNGKTGLVQHACINQTNLMYRGTRKGENWILALKTVPGRKNTFCIPWGDGLLGTRVDGPSEAKTESVEAALVAAVFQALDSRDAMVRGSAIRAVRHWEGGNYMKPGSRLWRSDAAVRKLLALARDPSADVRRQLAFSIPDVTGALGDEALFRLLFDRVRSVQQAAALQLQRRGHGKLGKALDVLRDVRRDEWTDPGFAASMGRKQTLKGANGLIALLDDQDVDRRAFTAWQLGFQQATPGVIAALERATQDGAFEVRRWAVGSLTRLGSTASAERLADHDESQFDHPDGRVSVEVARLLIRAGKGRRALDRAAPVLQGADARAAVQAVEVVATVPSPYALDLLLQAASHDEAVVRAFAAARLRDFVGIDRTRVANALETLRKDRHELVRAVARPQLD